MSSHTSAAVHASCGAISPQPPGEIVYLDVAPHVTAKTRFSSSEPRKVRYIMPQEALSLLDQAMATPGRTIGMAAITGPGDPLAVPDTTIKTVELVRSRYPRLDIGLRTLGVGGERFAADLAAAGVGYVELEVNGVSAGVLERLYAWIRPGLKTLRIEDAAALVVREQKNTVPAFKYHRIGVAIVTTLYPGYNVDHIGRIGSVMMELGADSIGVVAYEPETGAEVSLPPPDRDMLETARAAASRYLPVVTPLLTRRGGEGADHGSETVRLPKPSRQRPNVAVVSRSGIEIDGHLGQAGQVLVFGPRDDGLTCLLETRRTPGPGGGRQRWEKLAATLSDCFALLACQAGRTPRSVLAEHGITVLIASDNVEGTVDVLYGGGRNGKSKRT